MASRNREPRRDPSSACVLAALGLRAGLAVESIAGGLGVTPRHARRLLEHAETTALRLADRPPAIAVSLDPDDADEPPEPIRAAASGGG